jgi:YidC/Oxa1 family membrane protein insertase
MLSTRALRRVKSFAVRTSQPFQSISARSWIENNKFRLVNRGSGVRNYWWFQGSTTKSKASTEIDNAANGNVSPATGKRQIVENQEFAYPLTFGETHEIIPGGHVPESMLHINLIEIFLENLHELGMPWWAAISTLTVCFRLLVLPLTISLIRNSARLNVIKKDLEHQGKIMADAEAPEFEKLKAANTYSELLKENKCHPLYNIIPPFVMAPMFLSVFLAVERICLHEPTCRGAGGFLWFMDLSSIDPTFMLPVLSAATWLLTIELGAAEPRTEFMNQIRAGVRFAAAVMVPVTAALPSGVFVYWITSNIFSLFQIYILQRAFVRRFFGIPPRTQEQYAASNKPVTI